MVPVSVVIIAKNIADIIEGCIEKARKITDDVIIIYNGNDEGTANALINDSCRIYKKKWDGYGANKNKGIDMARYSWILSIDSDEIPDDTFINAIHQLSLQDKNMVYDIKFRAFFGDKFIRFGSWGRDHHVRLFNREVVKWSETIIHEKLILPAFIKKKKLTGHINHYSVKDINEFDRKTSYYAKLSAKKYFHSGRKTSFTKLHISPFFGFVKNYIICMGFLDGREGWGIAKTAVKNTRLKYQYLSQIEIDDKKQAAKDLVVEY